MRLKRIILGFIFIAFAFNAHAQLDNNMKAKLYFTEAQKLYEQGDFTNSMKYIEKAETTLGTTVARILALKIKVQYNLGSFISAKKLIDEYTAEYMQSATQELNDEVLALYINIEEAAEAAQGNFTDLRDGKNYKTIKIGHQVWMAENLNYASSNSWCYDNNSSTCALYGRLYTYETANNVCPSGWHLPSDDEWKQLEMAIGMSQSDADDSGWRGTNEGTKLKATSGWKSPGNGTDAYGFTALPGGYRSSDGTFYNIYYYGYWWSATEGNASARGRNVGYGSSNASSYDYNKEVGFSVRCVRD